MLGREICKLTRDKGVGTKWRGNGGYWSTEVAGIIGNGVGFAVLSPVYNDLVVVEGAIGQPFGPQLAKC
jgi:hypothetical protein